VGLGISQTNADSQYNSVYKAFHRVRCCGNEKIVSSNVNVIFDAANLLSVLEQVCGRQTPSACHVIFPYEFGMCS